MNIAQEIRERIFTAANSLYEQSGRTDFPTVDAVRKTARVNMNDASACMKDWRRAQMARVVPVALPMPAAVQQAVNAAMSTLWNAAQELANESLRGAQAGWEAERAEAETLNRQLADAHEAQAAELVTAQTEVANCRANAERMVAKVTALETDLTDTCRELAAARASVERAEARCIEIERRAGELRTELDHSHDEVAAVRADLAAGRQAHVTEIDALRGALVGTKAKAERAADAARSQLNRLREENASLRGQLEVLRGQGADFDAYRSSGSTD